MIDTAVARNPFLAGAFVAPVTRRRLAGKQQRLQRGFSVCNQTRIE